MRVGSLFAGIGGFDLGLERAGFSTAWFCEQDPYCTAVLNQHWPGVPVYPDIRELKAADVEPVDVLCGGFPCQDLSYAGQGAGLDGARSGLWTEYARLIGELGPRYVIVENVSALLTRGLGTVLGDLAALGYDAEWDCIPASAVGAPHRRDRIWLVAYPDEQRRDRGARSLGQGGGPEPENGGGVGGNLPYPNGKGPQGHRRPIEGAAERPAPSRGMAQRERERHEWAVEPDVGRVANGIPARVDRLRALGNALVPQVAEWIGHRIADYEVGR